MLAHCITNSGRQLVLQFATGCWSNIGTSLQEMMQTLVESFEPLPQNTPSNKMDPSVLMSTSVAGLEGRKNMSHLDHEMMTYNRSVRVSTVHVIVCLQIKHTT